MADRSDRDDDVVGPPEVTVPPWLRSGPTPGQSAPPTPGVDRSATEDTRADRHNNSQEQSSPNRITLGARAAQEAPVGQSEDPHRSRQRLDDLSTLPLHSSHAPETGQSMTAAGASDRGTAGLPDPARSSLGGPAATSNLAPSNPATSNAATSNAAATDAAASDGARGPSPVESKPFVAPPSGPFAGTGRGRRIALFAAAGVAILAGSGVLGYLVVRGIAAAPADDATACVASEEQGRVVGSGQGTLDTPAGAVLAFDHAYYVDRSAEKAWEAVSPSSRMSEDQLQSDGVDRVPEGTTHCVEIGEISPTLLDVTLTELPPEAEPVQIRQRIRMEENPDGTWGIVSITPAG